MKPNEIWNYLVVVFLIHLVFCDKRGINDVIFLLANLEDEKRDFWKLTLKRDKSYSSSKELELLKRKQVLVLF